MKNGSDTFPFLSQGEEGCAVIEVPEAAWQASARLEGKGRTAAIEIRAEVRGRFLDSRSAPLLRPHFHPSQEGRALAVSTASLRLASVETARLQLPETIAQLALWIASLAAIGMFLREIF